MGWEVFYLNNFSKTSIGKPAWVTRVADDFSPFLAEMEIHIIYKFFSIDSFFLKASKTRVISFYQRDKLIFYAKKDLVTFVWREEPDASSGTWKGRGCSFLNDVRITGQQFIPVKEMFFSRSVFQDPRAFLCLFLLFMVRLS